MLDQIEIKGARTHNLQNIDISIPKNKLVVITGLSGSGKSSLAFDTIYAEGQRKYVESLSAYARQFLGIMDKPDVDTITGLSPAISIDQKTAGHNPRSTVGTITEIYDYLRLLFARVGHPRSPRTGNRLAKQSVQQIVDQLINLPVQGLENQKLNSVRTDLKAIILAPIIKARKGTYEELFARLLSQGYVRTRVDGTVYNLEEEIRLDRFKKHNIEVVIDRVILKHQLQHKPEDVKRLTDSVETALNLGNRELIASIELSEKTTEWRDILFSEKYVDPATGESFPEVEPHTFSFNSPHGACKNCNGLGFIREIDPSLIINPKLSISEGGIYPWTNLADDPTSWSMQLLKSVGDSEGFSTKIPIGQITEKALQTIFFGGKDKIYKFNYTRKLDGAEKTYQSKFEGVIPNLMRRYSETESDYVRREIEKYMHDKNCDKCGGLRLQDHALAVTINGCNIVDVSDMSIEEAKHWIDRVEQTKRPEGEQPRSNSSLVTHLKLKSINPTNDLLSAQELVIGKQIFREIQSRLDFLLSIGLNYLTLSRTAKTLSGGEAQRIRLASQIGTGLTGVLYVLDEPSIGLHQKDNSRLLKTLQRLRDMGNSVLIVEHDEDTIRSADHIIDIGPGAGEHGGRVVAQGQIGDIIKSTESITGQYLSGSKKIDRTELNKAALKLVPKYELNSNNNSGPAITLKGASHNNLKNIDVSFPIGKFICVTGVSGSGKSSLINETLYPILARDLYGSKVNIGTYSKIEGGELIDKVVNIDQSAIGRTPRSNPATYTGLFAPIRETFAKIPEARARGYSAGRFSFNVKGGRCENCKGDGVLKIEMQFLSDVYVKCDLCEGKRYNREALQIDYKGKSIAEVLDMTVEEALTFFEKIPAIANKLETLSKVGLGYIRLGQSATTLSGGEAQRVKLALELSKRSTGSTLYILDEPTTGLHFEDVRKLLIVLHSLVLKGNTVIVIEHNLDVIKTSDLVIDLGPEGGDNGGEIIAIGTPEEVAKVKTSYTGQWLKKILNHSD